MDRRLKTILIVTLLGTGSGLLAGIELKTALGMIILGGAAFAWALRSQPATRISVENSGLVPQVFSKGMLNGRGWAGLGDNGAIYVCGFRESEEILANLLNKHFPGSEATTAAQELALTTGTHGEVSESITAFYADPMNWNIPVVEVMFWVKMKARRDQQRPDEFAAQMRAKYPEPTGHP